MGWRLRSRTFRGNIFVLLLNIPFSRPFRDVFIQLFSGCVWPPLLLEAILSQPRLTFKMIPLPTWCTHVRATVTLQLSQEPSLVMTYQACRPPQFPAGLNGAVNGKKTNQQLVLLKPTLEASCQLSSIILPVLLLPLSDYFTFAELSWISRIWMWLHCPHTEGLFVFFYNTN